MKIEIFIQNAAIFMLLSFGKCAGFSAPHIIFMLIDDLGWNDISFHGSPQIPTPNIDTLAFTGIILNNYYVQPLCTPSRGSLMTGKYPIRLGLQHYVIGAGEPWGLSPKETIMPQHLKNLGYATHGVGKWHLGYFMNSYLPINRGFDSFFGYYEGKNDFFTHFDAEDEFCGLDFHEGNKPAWNYTGYYSTELFTDKAKKIISNHDPSKPLFLYLSHQAVHSGLEIAPLQAPTEYIKKFSHIKDDKRRAFAAMTSALDWSVGEVFNALHEKDMLDNSIIVFTTDNGAAVRGIDKSTGSNWPLRGSKYNLWEGGVRGTAFIWSKLFPNSRQSVSNNLMHVSDWLPTLYAAAGGKIKDLNEIDGYSFWPSFTKNASAPRDRILLNIDSNWKVESIRKNQYKLIKGSVLNGKFDGWFDKEGKKKEKTPFNDEELECMQKIYKDLLYESKVLKILLKKYEREPLLPCISSNEILEYCSTENNQQDESIEIIKKIGESHFMHFLHTPIEVQCGPKPANVSNNCLPMEEYCLFDIEKDPCEYTNLAKALPSVTEDLKDILNKYRKQAVPIRNKPRDPLANPKYHGYAWVPWREEKIPIL